MLTTSVPCQDVSLMLWCLIENESVVFPVEVPRSFMIGSLKEIIQRKRDTLKDVGPHILELWKVDIDLEGRPEHSVSQLELSSLQGAEKLASWESVERYWSNQPPTKHLHIIVNAAAGKQKINTTPQEHAVDIEVIDKRIHKELESLGGVVEAFLRNPEPPVWVPPDYVTADNREFLTNLQLPSYGNGKPSLLFHNLDKCDRIEIEKMLGPGTTSLCICNTSRSGKTRRMLEVLTKYWGFYLVAVRDVNGVGVRDMHDALKEVTKDGEWMTDLRYLPAEQRANQGKDNHLIASYHIQKVLAARIVVFRFFLELAILVDGSLQEKHKRIWLLFQLSDNIGGPFHPFVQIIRNCLRGASCDVLDILVGRLYDIRTTCLPGSRFIIGLDEAQHAARLYPYSFVSSTNTEVFRSIIREMVTIFTGSSIKLIVAGTGLSLGDLTENMGTGVSKVGVGVDVHQLGMFDTWPKLKPYLERYIPPSILESPSGYRLQQRIREYLLGRYGFSVSFLECFMRNGLESPHRLLNEYVKELTACVPGDTGDPFTLLEPELRVKVESLDFEWDRLRSDSDAIQQAVQIVQSHLTRGHGQSPTFGPVTARLVEYGVARFREGDEGYIVEPLAFLSLMKWLETQNRVPRIGIESRFGFPDEELIIYLLRMLRYPVPFSAIFDLHSTSGWENEMACIVGRLDGNDVSLDFLEAALQNLDPGVVHYAASIEEVINWVDAPAFAPAVLVTSQLFGPDVMIRCSSSPPNSTVISTVLLLGQFKSFTDSGNKGSLDAEMLRDALTSLNRDNWFKQAPSHQRQKLIHAIEKHRVLRFIGGYADPPDLNLVPACVTDAIEALGPNVPLATIRLNAFRAGFISEGEARHVLTPMEDALARKREGSGMGFGDVKDSAPPKKKRKKSALTP
ncbi:hypothetical protein M413DRAFT_200359 [Hebeloma cylindrosporum]|uniref:Crinkler effector protein N-terminal domain-containing protein n=1 Tax=Hebeloma cylindrosporum TaxID=76867 RepID=A0A0C2YC65_HEBCY|nr:hypothetical protein M413DRAFT_200359 [Hebeloma cylindrosporum h7]